MLGDPHYFTKKPFRIRNDLFIHVRSVTHFHNGRTAVFITNHFRKGEEWRKGPDVVVPGAYRLHFETTTSFDELKTNVKTFETLEYNRDYQLDDFISFRDKLTGKSVMKRITYLLTDQPYVPYGYVILGLKDDEITMPY